MAKSKRPDIVEQVIRLSVRAAKEMRKSGVLMHTSITFGPLPKPGKRPKHPFDK